LQNQGVSAASDPVVILARRLLKGEGACDAVGCGQHVSPCRIWAGSPGAARLGFLSWLASELPYSFWLRFFLGANNDFFIARCTSPVHRAMGYLGACAPSGCASYRALGASPNSHPDAASAWQRAHCGS
jgi:hypothetical protein